MECDKNSRDGSLGPQAQTIHAFADANSTCTHPRPPKSKEGPSDLRSAQIRQSIVRPVHRSQRHHCTSNPKFPDTDSEIQEPARQDSTNYFDPRFPANVFPP